jgi:hypothetical protein
LGGLQCATFAKGADCGKTAAGSFVGSLAGGLVSARQGFVRVFGV